MDEASRQHEEQLKETDLVSEWLGESRFMVSIASDITDVLAMLIAKRTTLEEKMISRELHSIVQCFGKILAALHGKLSHGAVPPADYLENLRSLDFQIHECIVELLKALRYNLNYVEQYFEFNFCAKLTQECRFSEEAQRLSKLMEE